MPPLFAEVEQSSKRENNLSRLRERSNGEAVRVRASAVRDDEDKLRPRAKAMRREMTKAEIVLWNKLREANRHGFKFRRQHLIPPYIADFAHIRGGLVIEIDGETHGTEEQREYDRRREAYMRAQGWNIVRFQNTDVYENVDGIVEQLVRRLGPHPAARSGRPTSPASGRG